MNTIEMRSGHQYRGNAFKGPELAAVNNAEARFRKGHRNGRMIETMSNIGLVWEGDFSDVTEVLIADGRGGKSQEIAVKSFKFRDPKDRSIRTAFVPNHQTLREMVMMS